MVHTRKEYITGLILAGGRARRMGGLNKGAQQLNRQTLFEHIVQALSPQVNHIVISANQYLDFYAKAGFPIYSDIREGFIGPLGGIETVLKCHSNIQWLFCTPVDTPYIPSNLVATLYSEAKKNKALAVFPRIDTQTYPLHCLIHASLLNSLMEYLDKGERSVQRWLNAHSVIVNLETSGNEFININTMEELLELNTVRPK